MKKVDKLFISFNRLLGIVSGWLILVISILISYEVVMRYLFSAAPNWTSDVSRHLLIIVALCPAAYALYEKAHINVDFFINRSKKKAKKILNILYYIPVLIFSGVLLWKSFELFNLAANAGWKTMGNVPIPSVWIYAVIIFSSLMLILMAITRLVKVIVNNQDVTVAVSNNNELESVNSQKEPGPTINHV